MIDDAVEDTDSAGDEDAKLADDDASLAIAAQPRRALRPVAVIVALATLLVAGGGIATYLHHQSQAPIAEEPKAPMIARSQAVPSFLAAAPATPTPAPVEPLRPADPPPAPAVGPLPARPAPDPAIERARARDADLDEQARSAGVFFQTAEAPRRGAAPEPFSPSSAGTPQFVGPMPGAPGAAGESWDPNMQDHKNAFLNSPRSAPDYLASTLQRPISPYELKAGSIIPVTLIDGINSDLPGPVSAQVRERVFDTTTGEHLLVPQGAKLFGWYDSKVAWGQERVLLCWDRIIFPNGKSINLQCMPASDLAGQAGLTDQVDNHYDRLLAAVGLSTILAVGTQAVAGDPTGFQPTLAQTAARNASGQINNAGQAIVSRQLNLQPTITIRPGFAANLRVSKDIILEPYAE